MNKFKTNFIMFIVFVAYLAITFYVFMNTFPDSKIGLLVGVLLSLGYSIVCFFDKKLRSKMTLWWGVLSLLSFCWWSYLLVKGEEASLEILETLGLNN